MSFLNRTPLTQPLDQFLKNIQINYPIGTIVKYEEILEGYEDANFKLTTSMGNYILKIFSKNRINCNDYIQIIREANKISVPTIKLVRTNENEEIYSGNGVHCFIAHFFTGNNFYEIEPTLDDITSVTNAIALLNTLTFPIQRDYDQWGNKYFVIEFQKHESKLSVDDLTLLLPIVKNMQKLTFDTCKTGVIHGDMQRKHVLKNKKNEFCIIDYGCARNDALVFELSAHLAWFCFDENNRSKWVKIEKTVLTEYQKIHQLKSTELSMLPILIEATYGNYVLQSHLLIQEGDCSEQTITWNKKSRELLKLYAHYRA